MNLLCAPISRFVFPPSQITTTWCRKLTFACSAPSQPAACAFIFTAARNVAFDLFRRRRANPIEFGNCQAELVALDPQPGADEALDQHYELEVLAEAVRALPDRCRQVIMLRYLDGLAYKEIAEQLNISPETVKVHLAKGIRRCAAIFSERGLLDSTAPTNGKSDA